MASRTLEGHGMRLDDLGRVRVVDEETEGHASRLRDNCDGFLRDMASFKGIADSFINIFDHVSKAVEKEKLHAIGARNLLKSYSKHRAAQTQQLTSLVKERQTQLERLQAQYASLAKTEAAQVEFMEQLIRQK